MYDVCMYIVQWTVQIIEYIRDITSVLTLLTNWLTDCTTLYYTTQHDFKWIPILSLHYEIRILCFTHTFAAIWVMSVNIALWVWVLGYKTYQNCPSMPQARANVISIPFACSLPPAQTLYRLANDAVQQQQQQQWKTLQKI